MYSLVERVSLSADASSAGAGRAAPAFGKEEEVGETEEHVAAVDSGGNAAAAAASAAATAAAAAAPSFDACEEGGDVPLLPLAIDGEAVSLYVSALLAGGKPPNISSQASTSSSLPADLVRALEDAAEEALALPQGEAASHAEAAARVRRWVEHGSRHGGDVAASITAALAEEAAEDERRWQRATAA